MLLLVWKKLDGWCEIMVERIVRMLF